MEKDILVFTSDDRCGSICKAVFEGDYNLRFAANRKELKGSVNSSPPDLVVLHSQRGGECLEILKKLKKTTISPIFILSDENSDDLILKAWQEGACGFLVHPPKADVFYSWVSKTIGSVKVAKSPLEKARQHIELNYEGPITLGDIAQNVGYSAGHLCRSFKEKYGMPPMSYLQETRLRHAKRLLEETDCDLSAIIEKVGFRHTHYFCREFKKRMGVSPIEYRNSKRTIQ